MKYLLFLAAFCFSISINAQSIKNTDHSNLVEEQMNLIHKDLEKGGHAVSLSANQKVKIKSLISVKSQKILDTRNSKLGKLEMSNRLTEIDKEFDPAILEILNPSQRKVYKESPRNRRRFAQ